MNESSSPCPLTGQGGSFFNDNGGQGIEREPAITLSMIESVTFAIVK